MRLSNLLDENGRHHTNPRSDIDVSGLSADSRRIRPGFLFAALQGTEHDGREFIEDALHAGAIAVLGPPDLQSETLATRVPVITDTNPRRKLARMAARFYSAQPRTVAAVTGTNGKTSVAYFAQQFWNAIGHPAACVGTLGVCGPGRQGGASLTTPDPVELHRTLASLKRQGLDHLAIEASSHGLAQYRLDGIHLRAAAFTNLSRDHLDYHGGMAAYRAAKQRLFSELLPDGGVVVLNAESPEFDRLHGIADDRGQSVISYGVRRGDISCLEAQPAHDGWTLTFRVFDTRFATPFALPGEFQIANMFCALALVVACGGDAGDAAAQIKSLTGVPGRLERAAELDNGALVLVDYAHTPDALEVVLATLRPHVRNRLAVVFGCGGDRDKGKRPEMGRIAARAADLIFVTDDNPRGEDAAAIRQEVLVACPGAREIADRREAIAAAMAELTAGDLLLVAGKGHEEGQIVGDDVYPFKDTDVVRGLAGANA